MPARPAALELLEALNAALGRRRWYLFGAQAVNVHGRPRMTADVDVTVEVARDDLPQLVAQLQAAGFVLRVDDPAEFVKATSVLPFLHVATAMPLDLVVAASGLESMFLQRARRVDVGDGVVVPVISASDLVVAKIVAGRPKDIEDAVGVLREGAGSVDVDALRALVAEIEEALGQADLSPVLESALAAASGRKPPRKPRK